MPGLINMHVHLVGDGTPHSSSNAEGAVQKSRATRWHGDFAPHAESLAEKTSLQAA